MLGRTNVFSHNDSEGKSSFRLLAAYTFTSTLSSLFLRHKIKSLACIVQHVSSTENDFILFIVL